MKTPAKVTALFTIYALVSFSAFTVTGCGGGGGGGSSSSSSATTATYDEAGDAQVSSDPKVNIANYNTAVEGMSAALDTSYDAIATMMETIILDQTGKSDINNVTAAEVSLITAAGITYEQAAAYATALETVWQNSAKAMLYEYDSSLLSTDIMPGYSASVHHPDGFSAATAEPELHAQSPALFTLIGGAMLAYSFYKGAETGVDSMTGHARTTITKAYDTSNATAIGKIKTQLGLADSATKEEALAAWDDLGMSDKMTKSKEMVNIAFGGSNGVDGVNADDYKDAIKEGSVELGNTAVKTTVGASQMVTGGIMDKVVKAAGATETVANTVDLGVSLAGYSPNSIIEKSVTIKKTSTSTETVTLEKSNATVAESKATLKRVAGLSSTQPSTDDMTRGAADRLMEEMANQFTGRYSPQDNGSTVTVTKPKFQYIGTQDSIRNNDTITLPDFGEDTDLTVSIDSMVPETIPGLDITAGIAIGLEGNSIDQFTEGETLQEASATSYDMAITSSPAKPSVGDTVTFTAQLTPADADVKVHYNVTGTDGSNVDETVLTSDANGQVSFGLANIQQNVTHTVTFTVSTGQNKTFNYTMPFDETANAPQCATTNVALNDDAPVNCAIPDTMTAPYAVTITPLSSGMITYGSTITDQTVTDSLTGQSLAFTFTPTAASPQVRVDVTDADSNATSVTLSFRTDSAKAVYQARNVTFNDGDNDWTVRLITTTMLSDGTLSGMFSGTVAGGGFSGGFSGTWTSGSFVGSGTVNSDSLGNIGFSVSGSYSGMSDTSFSTTVTSGGQTMVSYTSTQQ